MGTPKLLRDFVHFALAADDFRYFQRLVHELAGIAIAERKSDLIASRLRARVIELGLGSYAEYRERLEAGGDAEELQVFVNLLTTNKTEFFREIQHFSYLVDEALPALGQGARVDAWCAACSTGEEAYTLAMLLGDHLAPGRRFEVLATDIDTKVLQVARNGVYKAGRLAEIPVGYRERHTARGRGGAAGFFKIGDETHRAVRFAAHNLIAPEVPGGQAFDLIFCRNVFIYFDRATVAQLALKFHRALKKGGLLFISHTESIPAGGLYEAIRPSVLRKR